MNFLMLGGCITIILIAQFPFEYVGKAQNQTSTKAVEQAQAPSPRFDTVQVLDQARLLSDDARGLEPLDEIPLQARLADAVWPLDQPFAERLLARSFELTVSLLKESKDSNAASMVADPQILFAHISSVASKHDPKLEKKLRDRWQEATASFSAKDSSNAKADPTQQSYLLLTQAANYLKTDEQRACQLFRQSVSLRVTQDHYFFLLNNRQRASEITDNLFSDTLDVLGQRPLSDANELLMLSSYLFSPNGGVTYAAISGYNTANVTANMSAVPKNAALARRYLALLLAKASANELVPSAVAFFALKNLLPQYQVFAPELMNDVYAKTASLVSSVSKDDSSTFDDAHKGSNASESEKVADWEKRIEKADKLEPEGWRDFEYFTIIFGYLLPKKDFVKAATLVGRISNQDLKEKFGDVVNLVALQDKLEKMETAASVSESDYNKIKTPLVRVVALSTLGRARLKQKATGDALRLFEQASGEANKLQDDQDRIQAKLMLVQLSLNVDSSVAFAWAAGAFKDINKFSDFNINRSNFSLPAPVYGLKNELSIESPAPSSLVSAVAQMCRVNCEETFQISRLIEKKEIRLWAKFFAVRTGLRESSRAASGDAR